MGFSSKHLTVFSPERVNIKKLANLTANTKNYRQITLNTKPHSDPHIWSLILILIYDNVLISNKEGRITEC